ncbi:hypothetical protein [Streptomyces sp. NPDC090022]|uniref:hypothetical protein n=1 Tax=Streptomyces sp. NPDC090022 TaxID=3365920 RepID=UPI00380483DF
MTDGTTGGSPADGTTGGSPTGGSPARGTQRGVLGRALITLGWTLRVTGTVAAFSGNAVYQSFGPGADDGGTLPWWGVLLTALALATVGWWVFDRGTHLVRRGKQHLTPVITAFEQLAGEPYVLYLRPFALDPGLSAPVPEPGFYTRAPFELPQVTQEEFLVRQVARLGRVIAVGQPGERLPLLGAERGYLPLDDWQNTVATLIRGAHVVMLSAAPGPGTVWEFTEAVRTVPPDRLLLLVCTGPVVYDLFRDRAARAYAERRTADWPPLPELPDWPAPGPPGKGRTWEYPLRGVISFDQAWQATFTPFEVSVPALRWGWSTRRKVRERLEPVLAPLAALPGSAPRRP